MATREAALLETRHECPSCGVEFFERLSARELEILQLVADGLTTAEVAIRSDDRPRGSPTVGGGQARPGSDRGPA